MTALNQNIKQQIILYLYLPYLPRSRAILDSLGPSLSSELFPADSLPHHILQITLDFPYFPDYIFYPLTQTFRCSGTSRLLYDGSRSGVVLTR